MGFNWGDLSTARLNVKCVSDPNQYRPQRLEQCVMHMCFLSTSKQLNMKQYIKQNFIPIIIGINIGMLAVTIVRSIEDTIIKIALIKSK